MMRLTRIHIGWDEWLRETGACTARTGLKQFEAAEGEQEPGEPHNGSEHAGQFEVKHKPRPQEPEQYEAAADQRSHHDERHNGARTPLDLVACRPPQKGNLGGTVGSGVLLALHLTIHIVLE